MKTNLLRYGLGGALLLAGAFPVAALDGVVIANSGVPAESLTPAALKDLYTGKTTYWDGGQAVTIISLGDKAEAALQEASGMSSSQFKTFWQRLAFSGRGQQPKSADDADKAVAMVVSTKGAIAIVPTGTKVDGVKTVAIK